MITKPILVSLLTSLLFSSGCAAKNRWLSRKDYSEMQDPFMQPDAVASTERSPDRTSDSAGRAKLDGLTADSGNSSRSNGSASLPGPKPIPKASTLADNSADAIVRPGRVASASYPKESESTRNAPAGAESGSADSPIRSYQGTALSEFLNRRKAEASSTAAPTPGDTRTQPAIAGPTAGSNSLVQTNPSPKLSAEAESFSSFLQQNPAPVTLAPKSAATIAPESSDPEADFAAWAEQQKSEWARGESPSPATVQTAGKEDSNRVARAVNSSASDAAPDFGTPDFDFEDEEKAQPLIREPGNLQQPSVAQSGFEPVVEDSKKTAPAAEANPFENPFDFEEHQPAVAGPASPPAATPRSEQQPSQMSSSRKSLDAAFQMDNGWKPAHMTRP